MNAELSKEEQTVVRAIAKNKTDATTGSTKRNTWGNGGSQYEVDLQGYGAEVAFCKMLNTYPDLTWHVRNGGLDSRLPDGSRVDVKYTSRVDGEMLVRKDRKKKGEWDICALLVGKFPKYEFVGFATEAEVFAARVTNYGYCDNYTLGQHELHVPSDLADNYGVNPDLF